MSKTTKIILYSFLSLILLVGIGFGIHYYCKSNKVVSILTMDINPSIRVSLNYKNKVVKTEGLNEDGKELLKNNDFKGDSLKDAIEDITELVIEKGYITEEDNSILINVEGKDIKTEVATLIQSEFKKENTECNIVIQEIDEEAKENATKYGISESKASYIESIIKENEDITFEELKDKSINQINQTIKEKEEQKQEEEQKKEEEQRQEESNSEEQRYGSDAMCEKVKVGLTNDEATAKAYAYLNKEKLYSMFMDAQTIASRYNEICTYETKVAHNQKLYTFYYNITTGELVHLEEMDWKAGNYEDITKILTDYFVTKYGASVEDIQVMSAGGTVNDFTKSASAIYNGVTYSFTIKSTTGEILSVSN